MGVYSFDGSGNISSINRSYRNASDRAYVLPTEDEWYKAAYYKPANDGSYSSFANGSNDPNSVYRSPFSGWNYDLINEDAGYMRGSELGDVEQNGTYNMMGNVSEWTETAYDGSTSMASARSTRGGAYDALVDVLEADSRASASPTNESSKLGFRVVAIPEPSSIMLVGAVSGIGLFIRRKFMR